eukprot:399830-Hanusia_phi.AAC.1
MLYGLGVVVLQVFPDHFREVLLARQLLLFFPLSSHRVGHFLAQSLLAVSPHVLVELEGDQDRHNQRDCRRNVRGAQTAGEASEGREVPANPTTKVKNMARSIDG